MRKLIDIVALLSLTIGLMGACVPQKTETELPPPLHSTLREVSSTRPHEGVYDWALTSDGAYLSCAEGLCRLDSTGSQTVIVKGNLWPLPRTILPFSDGSLLLTDLTSDGPQRAAYEFVQVERDGSRHKSVFLRGLDSSTKLTLLDRGKALFKGVFGPLYESRFRIFTVDLQRGRTKDIVDGLQYISDDGLRVSGGSIFALMDVNTVQGGPQRAVLFDSNGDVIGERTLAQIAGTSDARFVSPLISLSPGAVGVWIRKNGESQKVYSFYVLKRHGYGMDVVSLGDADELPQTELAKDGIFKAGEMIWLGGTHFAWRSLTNETQIEGISFGQFKDQKLVVHDVILRDWKILGGFPGKLIRTDDGSLALLEYSRDKKSSRLVLINPDGRERLSYSFDVVNPNELPEFSVAGSYVAIMQDHSLKVFVIENSP